MDKSKVRWGRRGKDTEIVLLGDDFHVTRGGETAVTANAREAVIMYASAIEARTQRTAFDELEAFGYNRITGEQDKKEDIPPALPR